MSRVVSYFIARPNALSFGMGLLLSHQSYTQLKAGAPFWLCLGGVALGCLFCLYQFLAHLEERG
ncbi:MAG: hypothetical protein DI628_08300 [Blastochloris viridis]|uniref:Uncharacterized protein n=1 Tax=Blastochloris viridis TaxID=1079 RepID=A0A6N4R9X1_BLAVI|nr:MAG: hypothetical protein DI628_08300 [Blastochloris viridis]